MHSKTKKALCLLSATALITTGCADVSQTSSISKTGQVLQETKILAEKTAADQYFQELTGTSFITLSTVLPGLETIQKDGKVYYSFDKKEDTTISGVYNQKIQGEKFIQEMIASGDVVYAQSETSLNVDSKRLAADISSDKEAEAVYNALLSQITMNYTYTFPYKVTKTNGTLSSDGYTVTFNDKQCKSNRIYAYTENDYSLSGITEGGISPKNKVSFTQDIRVKEGTRVIANGSTLSDGSHLLTAAKGEVQKSIFTIVDTKGPFFDGIKNNKYYKNNIYDIFIGDKTTAVASATLDKKKIKDVYSFDVTKSGKHTVIAKDMAGNTTKCVFYLDKTAPAIKGVKNGKTYYQSVKVKCSDNRKLNYVKVNGKKKKSSFTLKKKGKYTITAKDMAGNKKTVKITIR